MVCGADSLLEEISKFLNSPEVTLDLDIEPSDFPFATLTQIEHDDCGATYKVERSEESVSGVTMAVCYLLFHFSM